MMTHPNTVNKLTSKIAQCFSLELQPEKYLSRPFKRGLLLPLSLVCVACGGATTGDANAPQSIPVVGASCSTVGFETAMTSQLSQAVTDTDFSFTVERDDGRRYSYNRGASTMRTSYESASTSKLVTAVIIMRLVEQGYLRLDDKPQDKIPNWPIKTSDPLAKMTLTNLLSFTSGLTEEPLCLNAGFIGFESCVNSIASANADKTVTPGTEFYYASTHLQVAGLMAVKARGVATWQEIFNEFKQQTSLFASASYDLPSITNPRLAGGMHWTGEEYLAFLAALKKGQLLNPNSMQQLLVDRTANTKIVFSPAAELNEEWHYGFGLWHECESSSFNCTAGTRISSPGTYGAYPFWDRSKNYIGILARQGAPKTFSKGVKVERAVRPLVEQWSACRT